jgi:nucleoside-diphosphate-sugar epimerase
MRILVTGAGGFVGSHTARRLADRGHEVIATARRAPVDSPASAGVSLEGIDLVEADLAQDDLGALLRHCEAVIHCAARASPWGARELFWRDNVTATERLLAAAERAGTVRRFVHISTPSIYYTGREQRLRREQFTPPARWPTFYAETKWIAECKVHAMPALGPVTLRPRAVFGPGDRAIVPRLLAAAERGVMPLPGGGRSHTDLTYIDNLLDAIELALVAPAKFEGRAFNITNGEPVVVRELLERLFAALGLDVRFVPVPRWLAFAAATLSEQVALRRAGQPEPRLTRYGVGLLASTQTLSIEAARQSLGYAPAVSVWDGLARYAEWKLRSGSGA